MRTPAGAILWKSWRLSRLHLGVMVFIATFGGAALIVSPMETAASASWSLMLAGYMVFISAVWAGNIDNRKGLSLTLGFARPIPTWVLVSVPMAYIGITCAATYLVPVLGTIYSFRHALAERIFTPRGFAGFLVLWAAFALGLAALWLNPNVVAGGQHLELVNVVGMVLVSLMPLAVLALAPWSFGRIRHQ